MRVFRKDGKIRLEIALTGWQWLVLGATTTVAESFGRAISKVLFGE